MDRFLRESLMFQVFHNSETLSNAIGKQKRKKESCVRIQRTVSLVVS